MILCAYCQSQVEDDSFFCDQCGKEIMICTECGRTGQGKCCDEDGNELVSAKSISTIQENKSTNQQTEPLQNNGALQDSDKSAVTANVFPGNIQPPIPATNNNNKLATAPGLKLVNENLGLTIDIKSGEILGRTTGPYSNKLSTFSGISGKHLVFEYDANKGWAFRDVGSSNGTRYSRTNTNWQNTEKSAPNLSVQVENRSYILIANVEFVIQIDSHTNSGTQRI